MISLTFYFLQIQLMEYGSYVNHKAYDASRYLAPLLPTCLFLDFIFIRDQLTLMIISLLFSDT